jgi:hypothetical protein
MNFYINTKGLQDLSFADLQALKTHVDTTHMVTNLRLQLAEKITIAINYKMEQNGIVTFFESNDILLKQVLDEELSERARNIIRRQFELKNTDAITIGHLKVIHQQGINGVNGLGLVTAREIRFYLLKFGLIEK